MAARFPQSGSSVAYKIKAAYAGKIKALYWAAGADSVHRLRPGDTASTILTRTATGATFNSTDGRISGNSGGAVGDLFADYADSGDYGSDADDFTVIYGIYGDLYNGLPALGASEYPIIITAQHGQPDATSGFSVAGYGYNIAGFHDGGGGLHAAITGFASLTPSLETVAARYVSADPVNKSRMWINGSENTSSRSNAAPSGADDAYGTSGRPIRFGWSCDGGAGKIVEWEFALLGDGTFSDAELASITADPSVLIEAASSSATITLSPDPASVQVGSTREFTLTRGTAAGVGGVTYNLASDATGIATVPARVTITEGNTTATFNATGVSVGSANITATNAADSGETDTVALTVTAVTTKKAKFLVHPDFQSATGIVIEVNEAPAGGALTGAKLGFTTGVAAEATLEAGKAVIKVNAADVGASALAAATSVVAIFKGTTSASSPLGNAVEAGSVAAAAGTIIEE